MRKDRQSSVADLDHLGDFTTSVSRPAHRRLAVVTEASRHRAAVLLVDRSFPTVFLLTLVDGGGLAGPSSGAWVIVVSVVGALIIIHGTLQSERIRGHGILESRRS
jgi:hypothetical protein